MPQHPSCRYQKPWLSYHEQANVLQSRGLHISDLSAVTEFLQHVNYYRFSGYCLAFETARHQFQDSVTFEQVRGAYRFDQALRDLITEALELVEIDFRTAIAYHFGEKYGPFGHTHAKNFHHPFHPHSSHRDWQRKLHSEAKRSSELFVKHFEAHYQEFPALPVWVITELMSFGSLSRMGQGMLKEDQKNISHRYGLQPKNWVTWMHHLTYVRNLCAHHARLWDRVWAIKPELPHGKAWKEPYLADNTRLLATLYILNTLMKHCPAIAPFRQDWKSRVEDLLAHPPAVCDPNQCMGLAPHWETHSLWE